MDSLLEGATGLQLWLLKMRTMSFMEQPPAPWQLRVLDALLACGVPFSIEPPQASPDAQDDSDSSAVWLGRVARSGSVPVLRRLLTAFPTLPAAHMLAAEESRPLDIAAFQLVQMLGDAEPEEVGGGSSC